MTILKENSLQYIKQKMQSSVKYIQKCLNNMVMKIGAFLPNVRKFQEQWSNPILGTPKY